MKRPYSYIVVLTGFAICSMALAQTKVKVYDFESSVIGKPPLGFTSYPSGGGAIGQWTVVQAPGKTAGKKAVQQTIADSTDNRFPVLIATAGTYSDVDVSVKGYAVSGSVDQGIGLVFRFRDPKSYYVCRANALENNFRLYKMVDGNRIQFAGADAKVTTRQWHTLRAVAKGDHIVCYFNGKALIDAHDKSYARGKVGLWTKADSVIAFDDLTVGVP